MDGRFGEVSLDQAAQRLGREWFADVAIEAGFDRPLHVGRGRVRCVSDQDQRRPGRLLAPERIRRRVPVHDGHVDIQKNEVRLEVAGHFHGLKTVIRGGDLVAFEAQKMRHHVRRIGIIVDD